MMTYDLGVLLGAGLPLLQALEVLSEQTTDVVLRGVLQDVSREIQVGSRFSEALGRFPTLFSPLYRGIVGNGETTGRLDLALERLAAFLERDLEFRRKVRDILVYPAMVMAMAGVVLTIFLIYIIPAFDHVYRQAGASLPPLTKALVAWSRLTRTGMPVLVPCALVLLVPQTRRWLLGTCLPPIQRALLTIPITRNLARTALLGRFAHSMAMVLHSGVPLLSALDVAGVVGGPREFGSVIDTLKRSIVGGRRLTEAMRATGWFTPTFLNMVNVGEETGKLETMIARTAAILDREFDVKMRQFLTLLEPLLILMVGSIVGVILMALYLPMFGLARAVMH
jgi:type IV pilus assembly protein PilC